MFSHVNSLASAAAISEVTFGEPREPPTQYQNGIGYTVTQSVHFGHGSNSMSDIVSDFGEQKLRKQRNQPHFQHSERQFEDWAAENSNASKQMTISDRKPLLAMDGSGDRNRDQSYDFNFQENGTTFGYSSSQTKFGHSYSPEGAWGTACGEIFPWLATSPKFRRCIKKAEWEELWGSSEELWKHAAHISGVMRRPRIMQLCDATVACWHNMRIDRPQETNVAHVLVEATSEQRHGSDKTDLSQKLNIYHTSVALYYTKPCRW